MGGKEPRRHGLADPQRQLGRPVAYPRLMPFGFDLDDDT